MSEKLRRLAAAAGLATLCLAGLSACGGGSGNSGDGFTQQQRDDMAASSWPGMLNFAEDQVNTQTSDTTEPRPIAGITPPLPETVEPAAI